MASRIPTKPADLVAQLQQAGIGIGNEVVWPVAPSNICLGYFVTDFEVKR